MSATLPENQPNVQEAKLLMSQEQEQEHQQLQKQEEALLLETAEAPDQAGETQELDEDALEGERSEQPQAAGGLEGHAVEAQINWKRKREESDPLLQSSPDEESNVQEGSQDQPEGSTSPKKSKRRATDPSSDDSVERVETQPDPEPITEATQAEELFTAKKLVLAVDDKAGDTIKVEE